MEVPFTEEQETRVSQIAAIVEETSRFRTAVAEGVAQADRSELVDDDEVLLWLKQKERF